MCQWYLEALLTTKRSAIRYHSLPTAATSKGGSTGCKLQRCLRDNTFQELIHNDGGLALSLVVHHVLLSVDDPLLSLTREEPLEAMPSPYLTNHIGSATLKAAWKEALLIKNNHQKKCSLLPVLCSVPLPREEPLEAAAEVPSLIHDLTNHKKRTGSASASKSSTDLRNHKKCYWWSTIKGSVSQQY